MAPGREQVADMDVHTVTSTADEHACINPGPRSAAECSPTQERKMYIPSEQKSYGSEPKDYNPEHNYIPPHVHIPDPSGGSPTASETKPGSAEVDCVTEEPIDLCVMESPTDKEDEPLDLSLPKLIVGTGEVIEAGTYLILDSLPEPDIEELNLSQEIVEEVVQNGELRDDANTGGEGNVTPKTPVQDELDQAEEVPWGDEQESEDQARPSIYDPEPGTAPWDEPPEEEASVGASSVSTARIRRLVKDEGVTLGSPPKWSLKNRGFSIQILHDGLLSEWPRMDTKCSVVGKQLSVKKWIRHIEGGTLHFRGHMTVIMFKGLHECQTPDQLNRILLDIVTKVRAATGDETRIFFSDMPPAEEKVLGIRIQQFNNMLEQVIQSFRIKNNGIQRVFLAEMSQYFKQKRASKKYLTVGGQFTRLGCIHYRARLFKEVGITSYD